MVYLTLITLNIYLPITLRFFSFYGVNIIKDRHYIGTDKTCIKSI